MGERRRAARVEGVSPPGLGPDAGPHPVARAVVALLLGVAAGLLAALVTPRPERGAGDTGWGGGTPDDRRSP